VGKSAFAGDNSIGAVEKPVYKLGELVDDRAVEKKLHGFMCDLLLLPRA
jgi:hypothetical protein